MRFGWKPNSFSSGVMGLLVFDEKSVIHQHGTAHTFVLAKCPPLLPPHFCFASSSVQYNYHGRSLGEYHCNTLLLLLICSLSLF